MIFQQWSTSFNSHKDGIVLALNIRANSRIDRANVTLLGIHADLDVSKSTASTILLLDMLRSPEERRMLKLIQSKGGPDAIMANDELFAELLKEGGDLLRDSKSKISEDQFMASTRADYQADLDKTLKRTEELFRRTARQESDRVITTILSGPVPVDESLRDVWTDMVCKPNVNLSSKHTH